MTDQRLQAISRAARLDVREWRSWCPRCMRPERCTATGDRGFSTGDSYRWSLMFRCGFGISTLCGPGERRGKRLRLVSHGR